VLVPLQTEAEAPADVTYDLNVYFEARAGGVNRGDEVSDCPVIDKMILIMPSFFFFTAMFNNITYQV
jgi:hypothetical protein